jgi:hypothetical protein
MGGLAALRHFVVSLSKAETPITADKREIKDFPKLSSATSFIRKTLYDPNEARARTQVAEGYQAERDGILQFFTIIVFSNLKCSVRKLSIKGSHFILPGQSLFLRNQCDL